MTATAQFVDEGPCPVTSGGTAAAAPTSHLTPLACLVIGIWFGLLSGLGESLFMTVRLVVRGQIVFDTTELHLPVPVDVIWMAPLSNLFLFSVVGGVFCVLAFIRQWLAPRPLYVFVFAFLAFCSLRAAALHAIHETAWLVLCAGLACVVVRIVARHPAGFQRLVRRTVVGLAVLVAGVIVGFHAIEAAAERSCVANLPLAEPGAPNVLLLVMDTVRAQNLSVYGYHRPTTPNLERLAETGVRFEWAISPSPWTLPSHASMFTGRWPHELSANWKTPLDSTYPTLAEVLAGQGYCTAGFVANRFYCTKAHGLHRGFVHYDDGFVSTDTILTASYIMGNIATRFLGSISGGRLRGWKRASDVNAEFLDWLSSRGERPFFAFLNYMDAHAPYLPPPPFAGKFAVSQPDTPWPEKLPRDFAPEQAQRLMDCYDECVASLDDEIGVLLAELDRRGLLENTVVIVVADHGEQFGEHGLLDHGNSLYLPLLRVPLIVSYPGRVPPGVTAAVGVSLRDLPATVMDLLGPGTERAFPGTSLAGCWDDAPNPAARSPDAVLSDVREDPWAAKWLPTSKGDMASLVDGRHHYIKNGDGVEELYDFQSDPEETRNLAPSPQAAQAMAYCRARLKERMAAAASQGAPRQHGRPRESNE